jgi:hypothetical protein
MTKKERKEFLARWLMEFGSGVVSCDVTCQNEWYMDQPVTIEDEPDLYPKYLVWENKSSTGTCWLTEAGLKEIAK